MFFLQKPKFPMHMNQIDISQKILRPKNYFPRILCFSPAISHILTSTKMGFPGNRSKMVQLHNNIRWYMPHFDRTDLLESKKQVWGGFRNLSDLTGPIFENFRIFPKIWVQAADREKPIFLTFESEYLFSKIFFFQFCSFP